jgi:hypothetical protein
MENNIYNEIKAHLESLKCKWVETSGIVFVTTPEGVVWDFTIPMRSKHTTAPEPDTVET